LKPDAQANLENSPLNNLPGARSARGGDKPARFRVLCVDDEPNILEGLRNLLEGTYDFHAAESGKEALALMDREEPFGVVISDMRMPDMDGAAFLERVRIRSRDTVRMLLTGYADIQTAIAAVNGGHLFRFLTKPCPPAHLLASLHAATEHYALVSAERVLLDQTLHGSIRALTDVLALTHPLAFGRALRIHKSVAALADRIGMKERWQVEVAAMLSQIGCLALPQETIEKLHYGQELTAAEAEEVNGAARTAARLLGNIPRLESVRAILGGSSQERRLNVDELVHSGSHILRIASDYDLLEARGFEIATILEIMRGRGDRYNQRLLDEFAALRESQPPERIIREVPLRAIKRGMILVEDLLMQNGVLVATRGYEITDRFVERVQHWRRGTVREPVRVVMPAQEV